MNIYITDGDFPALLQSLKLAFGDKAKLFASTYEECASTKLLDGAVINKEYIIENLLADCLSFEPDVIFPVQTRILEEVASRRVELETTTGALIMIDEPEVIRIANNKLSLYAYLQERLPLLTPFFSRKKEVREAIKEVEEAGFSACIKPQVGENASGFRRISSDTDYVPDSDQFVVMEYLDGDEFDVDCLCDEGELLRITMRRNLKMRGGLSADSKTIEDMEILEATKAVVKALNLSFINCITFRKNSGGQLKLIEINPRTFGSIDLSTFAGNGFILDAFELLSHKRKGTPLSSAFPTELQITPSGIERINQDVIEYKLDSISDTSPLVWKPLAELDPAVYSKYLKQTNSICADLTYSCRIAWDNVFNANWAIVEDCLVIVSDGGNYTSPFMLMPLGMLDTNRLERIILKCKVFFEQNNYEMQIRCIDKARLELFEKISLPHGEASYAYDSSDYIYDYETLSTLKGAKMTKKRNHLSKFLRECPDYKYVSLTKAMKSDVLKLCEKWCQLKGANKDNLDASDYRMIERAMDYFDEGHFAGGMLYINDTPVALGLGAIGNNRVAHIHFEKAIESYPGIYVAISTFVLQNEFAGCQRVNREEDLGIPGLRKAKESNYPIEKADKYKLTIF